MSEPRRYSLAEIDAMRDYFRSCTEVVMVDPTEGLDRWHDDFDTSLFPVTVPISQREAEMRLRTAMMGGVDPREFTKEPSHD